MKYFLFILGASFCLSCGDDPEDPLASAAGFCEEWAEAACSEEVVDGCSTDEEDCLAAAAEVCGETVTSRSYGGADGASECLSAVSSAFEDAELTLEEFEEAFALRSGACDAVLSGDGEEGDSCDSTAECDRSLNLECVFKDGDGTCVEPEVRNGGQSCEEPEQVCAVGNYCNGEDCLAQSEEDEDCSDDVPCLAELRCDNEVCVPKAANNDDCTTNDDCASGLCDVGPDGENGLCFDEIELSTRSPACENFRL